MASKVSERSKVVTQGDSLAPIPVNAVATKPAPDAASKAQLSSAESQSQLYFYRNKAKLLEHDLATVQARAKQDMAILLDRANQAVAVAAAGDALVLTSMIEERHAEVYEPQRSHEVPNPLQDEVANLRQELAALTARLEERDTTVGMLDAELARRDTMMHTMAFRIAWKYQRLPTPLRLVIRAAILPFVAPYLVYRSLKMRGRA